LLRIIVRGSGLAAARKLSVSDTLVKVKRMAQKVRAIVIHEKDTVAVALESLPSGTDVSVDIGDSRRKVRLVSAIPMGHKFALVDIAKGTPVIKYGEPIGLTTAPVVEGEHVHVHNLAGQNEGGKGGRS
jgi:altronate dehydratase small subunit